MHDFDSNLQFQNCSKLVNSPMNGEINTECFLKETENIVAALQSMLHTDLKSVSASTVKPGDGKHAVENKYSNTKFNRTFRYF